MLQLNDPSLLCSQGFINGQWCDGDSGDTRAIVNPATGQVITRVAVLSESQAVQAVESAEQAWVLWRGVSAETRGNFLRQWHQLVLDNTMDLATILTAEQGKPLDEAEAEISYSAAYLKLYAEQALLISGNIIHTFEASKRLEYIKQPVGVVAAITPWNFPTAMLARKLAPAVAAGCAVVCKPASATPLSALALIRLAERAGLPKGLLNIVMGEAKALGKVLTTHPKVRKLTFTGSTATGKILLAQAASTVKKVSMELGGNAPFIVFNDADIDAAIDGAMAAKFRNAGQTCICANRFLVQRDSLEGFTEKMLKKVKQLTVGEGIQAGVDIGPLISAEAVDGVAQLVSDSVANGATVLCGGEKTASGRYYLPTVLVNLNDSMRIYHEEIFGPVVAIYSFDTEEQAIAMANNTPVGLASYCYTQNMARVKRVSEALEYGMVGINTGSISSAQAPFGGIKESGYGREGGELGIEEYLNVKYINQYYSSGV